MKNAGISRSMASLSSLNIRDGVAIIVALGLSFPATAATEDPCAILQALEQAAGNNFSQNFGSADPHGLFGVNINLPNAVSCYGTQEQNGHRQITCEWYSQTVVEANAQARQLVADFHRCFSDNYDEGSSDSIQNSYHYISTDMSFFNISQDGTQIILSAEKR